MPINWQYEIFQQLDSTQTLAHERAQDDAQEGLVVQAMSQTSGRGRHGNQWDAPIGNLYMSYILRPECSPQKAGQISFVTALAVSSALKELINPKKHKIEVKWPNDILVDGLKISGILLESNLKAGKIDSLIIGIGVNVFRKPDLAICLNDVAEDAVYINKLRDSILSSFNEYYDLWQKEGFLVIRDEWSSQAYKMGQEITARLPDTTYQGIFEGITEEGALILKMPDGNKEIHAAEVYFGKEN